MIIGWRVTIKGRRVFKSASVLACFDWCVANGYSTKIVKPIFDKQK